MERGDISLDLADLSRLALVLGESVVCFLSDDQADLPTHDLCRVQLEESTRIFLSLSDAAFRREMVSVVFALAQYAQRREYEFRESGPEGDVEEPDGAASAG